MLDSPISASPDKANLAVKEGRSESFSSPYLSRASGLPSSVNPAFHIAAETLAQLGSPALVFDGARNVLAANCLIEALNDYIRLRAQGRLSFHDTVADAIFREAAAELEDIRGPSTRAFTARCSEVDTMMIARILPIRSAPGAATAHSAGILVFTPLTPLSGPPVELLRSLFDLTPSEARVARGLAAGATIDELASTARVSRNTVRSQLRGIMEKTGCHRQAEAVGLFCRIGIDGGSNEITAFA